MSNFIEKTVASFLGADCDIQWEDLKPITCFVVLWSHLEWGNGKFIKLSKLENLADKVVASDTFCIKRYEQAITYFKNRYTKTPELLDKLFRHDNRSDEKFEYKLRQLVNDEEMSTKERLEAILMIPYRIRNNLFHGNKGTINLYKQIELFENVNRILCQFHSDLDEAKN